MEQRKITIVSTSAQKKYVINTDAETLGQLKAALNEANIYYNDMDFIEGLTKTEMKDDSSVLPTNVKRINSSTGEETTTNELIFLLTNSNKKIKSGAMTRQDIYNEIKKNNLQDAVKEVFGKNFTQCSTSALMEMLETTKITQPVQKEEKSCNININGMKCFIDYLESTLNEILNKIEAVRIAIADATASEKNLESPYTDEEINSIISSIK